MTPTHTFTLTHATRSLEHAPTASADGVASPTAVAVLAGWLRCEPCATSIDFRDACLSTEEARVIAEALPLLPKLASINVLRNESMGSEGAAHFSEALVKREVALQEKLVQLQVEVLC